MWTLEELNMGGHYSIEPVTQNTKNMFKKISIHYWQPDCLNRKQCNNITKFVRMGDDFSQIDMSKVSAQIVVKMALEEINVMNVGLHMSQTNSRILDQK